MIKKIFLIAMLLIFTLSLVSCNSSIKNHKILEDELLVYTTYPDEVMKYITEEFKNETGITIDYKIINSDIQQKLKDANPDIILGGSIELHNKLKNQGVLTAYKISWFNEISENDKGIDGSWYSTIKEPIVLFYNSKYISANNAPKSWIDLANKTYRDKIIMEGTDNQYIKNVLSNIMYQFEKDNKILEGITFLQGFKDNVYKFENNSEELFKDIQNKETPIGISKLSDFNKAKNDNIPIVEVVSTEPSIFEVEAVSVLKNAKHQNTAKLFLEFVAGPKVQLELANKFNIIPCNKEALKYSPEWMKTFIVDKKISTVNEESDKWVNEFNNFQKNQTDISSQSIDNTNKVNKDNK